MSYSFNGAADVLLNTQTPVPANTSFSMGIWQLATDETPSADVASFALGQNSSGDQCYVGLSGGTGTIGCGLGAARDSSTSVARTANNPHAASTWFLVIGQFTVDGSNNVTNIDVWTYNGSAEGTLVSSGAITRLMSPALSRTVVGARPGGAGTYSNNLVGKAAHAFIYNKLLNGTERTELATKIPPLVAASDLGKYWPLLTGPEAHASYGGATYDFTVTGATLNNGDGPTLTTSSSSVAPLAAYYRMLRAS